MKKTAASHEFVQILKEVRTVSADATMISFPVILGRLWNKQLSDMVSLFKILTFWKFAFSSQWLHSIDFILDTKKGRIKNYI